MHLNPSEKIESPSGNWGGFGRSAECVVPQANKQHPPKVSGHMRIVVDLNRCLGYAQCAFLAPDVFKLNGDEALMYDPNPDEATRLRVLRAAAACPVQAIVVEDRPGEVHKG
jgi:ferredoxin